LSRFRSGDVQGDRTTDLINVGLILGPYRNLTTLTASILSLHPDSQVLNHGGKRLLRGRQDFIAAYSDERLDRFCTSALEASVSGKRGDYGGSIRLSHAFDSEAVSVLYEDRYGNEMIKEHIACLVWKESQLVTNKIRSSPDKINHLIEVAPRLRYLMPVRNPLDCAMSNMRTGHADRIEGADHGDLVSVLDRILESIAWFSQIAAGHPECCFMFFQDEAADVICDGLVRALGIKDDEEWRRAVAISFDVKGKQYDYEPSLLVAFDASLSRHFGDLPDVAGHLEALVRSHRPSGE
jgi:hypothetical protein